MGAFSNVTIVNVDGRHGDHHGTQLALVHSARELPGARAMLLSPDRPSNLLDGIEHIPIEPFGYFEYGLFVIYALHTFIPTDFALLVQDDGWVLDGRNWRDDFFNFDYIGAPIHIARMATTGGYKYANHFLWEHFLDDPAVSIEFVMNGGFSLRSKKLLSTPSTAALPYVLPPMSHMQGPPYGMRWRSHSHLEDVHLCFDMRTKLEALGIKYAPLDVARMFAFEHLSHRLHVGLDLMQILGHHSKVRKMKSIDPLCVDFRLTEREVAGTYGESSVAELFRLHGYTLDFCP
jgi:hypothetical protein